MSFWAFTEANTLVDWTTILFIRANTLKLFAVGAYRSWSWLTDRGLAATVVSNLDEHFTWSAYGYLDGWAELPHTFLLAWTATFSAF